MSLTIGGGENLYTMFRRKKHIVIIGGGHNGLICAAYLAEKHRVTVYEARGILGGCASTEELWPGFKVSPAAYVVSLLDRSIINGLKLEDNGFKLLKREPSSYTPDLSGPGLLLGADTHLNKSSIGFYNTMDAERFAQYNQWLEKFAKVIEPFLYQTPVAISSKRIGVIIKFAELMSFLSTIPKAFKADKTVNIQRLLDFLFKDAASLLDTWFSSDILKATLATDAVIGAFRSPTHPGTAYVLLHHVMGNATGDRGIWGYVQGGMGGLADALERVCRQRGVEICRESPISEIRVVKNSVYGLTLVADNRFIECDAVASSIDARTTLRKCNPPLIAMPADINRVDYSSASAKINLALDDLPNFIGNHPGRCNGTIHIAPSMRYIEQAYYDARFGSKEIDECMSEKPVLEITTPSIVDSSIAPAGKHIMSIFIQYVAYMGLQDENDLTIRRDFLFQRVMRALAPYCSRFEELILHSQVLLPEDLEKTYGLTGGNIFQGAMDFSNLFMTRPSMSCCDYRTPIKGLYLCGAAAHPGGGVMGLVGKHAAREIIKDL